MGVVQVRPPSDFEVCSTHLCSNWVIPGSGLKEGVDRSLPHLAARGIK